MRPTTRCSPFRHVLMLVNAAALLLSVSCEERRPTTTMSTTTTGHVVQSDFVTFDIGSALRQAHVSPEQTFESDPKAQQRLNERIEVPAQAMATALVEKEIQKDSELQPKEPPSSSMTPDPFGDARDRSTSRNSPTPPLARIVNRLPISEEPPEEPQESTPLAPPPSRDNQLMASDVALLVGSLSFIVGTTAIVNGSREEGYDPFGISMMGAGLASYATAGILSWTERSGGGGGGGGPQGNGTTTRRSIVVGPGLSVRGTF